MNNHAGKSPSLSTRYFITTLILEGSGNPAENTRSSVDSFGDPRAHNVS
jgi:hypothetical protein